MIDGQNFFDQLTRSNSMTNDSIQKTATDQGDDYTTGCLLAYNYFKKYLVLNTINLSKQQALDADPKTVQQINV